MKIEKVNENQIRCTLTREDLANRELKISELAYGTEKAKNLFRDMMQQASFEFGFEAEDIPLMIEAIPLNSECIVLIITKVEDPEELDTRFSKFAPSVHDDESDELDELIGDYTEGADDILDLFKKIHANSKASSEQAKQPTASKKSSSSSKSLPVEEGEMTRIFEFDSLNSLTTLSAVLSEYYSSENSLYKDETENKYLLVITKGKHTPEEFNRVCNVISEYGILKRTQASNYSYLEEHYVALIPQNAIESLALIK